MGNDKTILLDYATNLPVAKSADEIEANATQFAQALLGQKSETALHSESNDESTPQSVVAQLGYSLQKEAMRQSEMLRAPLRDLSRRGEEGGDVAKSLINLKVQVEGLDPGKLDLEPGWFSRTVGRIPGIGTPMQRYFSKFESAQTVISAILRSLEVGKVQLERDNLTLSEDQKRMRELSTRLEQAVQFGRAIDQKLQYSLDREIEKGSPQAKFVAEELVFPLRQRIMDLQQQLAVNQQGVVATELIVRNNQELARGVDRALNVTVAALHVAVTVAMALDNQKIVLDKIDAIGKTTSDLIAGTASRLKTQGVEIQKRASSTTLNIESLKSAFSDLNTALADIGKFRQEALPQMAQKVLELDQISTEAKKAIEKMDQGQQMKAKIGEIK
jgi:uncharacterized protein YaaN involved in tellurite resistance